MGFGLFGDKQSVRGQMLAQLPPALCTDRQTDKEWAPSDQSWFLSFLGVLVRGLLPHLCSFLRAMPSHKGQKVPQVPAFVFRRNWNPNVTAAGMCCLGKGTILHPSASPKSTSRVYESPRSRAKAFPLPISLEIIALHVAAHLVLQLPLTSYPGLSTDTFGGCGLDPELFPAHTAVPAASDSAVFLTSPLPVV